MDLFFSVMRTIAVTMLDIVDIAFLLRVIFSWIPIEENGFTNLLYQVTEPLIYPVRRLLYRLNLFQDFPLDMSFFFAMVSVSFLRLGLASL